MNNSDIWFDMTDWAITWVTSDVVGYLDTHRIAEPTTYPINAIVTRETTLNIIHPVGNRYANAVTSLIVIAMRALQHYEYQMDDKKAFMKIFTRSDGLDVMVICKIYIVGNTKGDST